MLPQALRLLSERNRRRCGVVLRLMWSPCGTHAARRAGSRRLCSRVAPPAMADLLCVRVRQCPVNRRHACPSLSRCMLLRAGCTRDHQGYALLSGFAQAKKSASHSEIRCITSRATRALLVQQRCMTYQSSGVKPICSCSIAASKSLLHTVTFFRDVRPQPRMP